MFCSTFQFNSLKHGFLWHRPLLHQVRSTYVKLPGSKNQVGVKSVKRILKDIFIITCCFLHQTTTARIRHVNEGICHVLGPPSMCILRKRLPPSLLSSPAERLLSLGHSSESGRPKFSWSGENVNRLFPECLHSMFFISFVAKDRRLLRSSSCTSVLPKLNNGHHFLTLPSVTTPSAYNSTVCLWSFARRTF